MVKTGIYVGSFNPPHLGHKKIMNYLLDNKFVDNILIVPVSRSDEALVSKEDRYNMLSLLNIKNTKVIKDTYDYNSSFIYQIIDEIKEEKRLKETYIIMDIDDLEKTASWDLFKFTSNGNKIICIGGNDKDELLFKEDIIQIDSLSDISSLMIRDNLEDNKDKLPEEIYNYIKEHKLYVVNNNE